MQLQPTVRDANGRWFGFWHLCEDDGFPDVNDVIDTKWEPNDLDQLIHYLKESPLLVTMGTPSYCFICPDSAFTSGYRSDGKWLWEASLFHYLEVHSVKPPDAMLKHIRDCDYKIAECNEIDVDSLDWPVPRPGSRQG